MPKKLRIPDEAWKTDCIDGLLEPGCLEILLGNSRNPCMDW